MVVISWVLVLDWSDLFNSLAPGGFDHSLKLVNFKLISTINILSIFCEIAIRWMPQHLTDHESTLVQVMAWCRQATSHYLSQGWPRSLLPYDVTRPQWVNHFFFKVVSLAHFTKHSKTQQSTNHVHIPWNVLVLYSCSGGHLKNA